MSHHSHTHDLVRAIEHAAHSHHGFHHVHEEVDKLRHEDSHHGKLDFHKFSHDIRHANEQLHRDGYLPHLDIVATKAGDIEFVKHHGSQHHHHEHEDGRDNDDHRAHHSGSHHHEHRTTIHRTSWGETSTHHHSHHSGDSSGAPVPFNPFPGGDAGGPISGGILSFLNWAKAQVGDAYVAGAEGPNAFDCSGLVYAALRHAGINVPRLTARGYQSMFAGSEVGRNDLKPGDLLFYWYPNDRGIPQGKASHIEIYIGNGMSVGAESPRLGVRTQKVNWNALIAASEVPQLQQSA